MCLAIISFYAFFFVVLSNVKLPVASVAPVALVGGLGLLSLLGHLGLLGGLGHLGV